MKIIEIEIKDDGIIAKCIPFNDRRSVKKEKAFNIENEFNLIRALIASIRKSVSFERIEVFEDLDLNKLNFHEFNK